MLRAGERCSPGSFTSLPLSLPGNGPTDSIGEGGLLKGGVDMWLGTGLSHISHKFHPKLQCSQSSQIWRRMSDEYT